jgi:hypothetical protein
MLNFSGRLLNIDELVVLAGTSAVYVVIALVISLVWLRAMPGEKVAQPAHALGKSG